uniref:Uncharacterized protein n=1 Tax=Candidatus Kentrum sp. TUN TaxID=2126343 RepID=A0A450ZDR1_9GAMM|nr:MAG: hypothetical protein BECKTUN1418D_GA0071000_10132 [Candidatus Kentron sp. TUN]
MSALRAEIERGRPCPTYGFLSGFLFFRYVKSLRIPLATAYTYHPQVIIVTDKFGYENYDEYSTNEADEFNQNCFRKTPSICEAEQEINKLIILL